MLTPFTRLARRNLLALGVGALTLNSAFAIAEPVSDAALTSPQPFEAQYRLNVRGWPNATITHRLANEGAHWMSDMRFSVAIARGEERSRFQVGDGDSHALLYSSDYSLLGVGSGYQLSESQLTEPDRQTALFDLSRRAGHEACSESEPCDLHYLDHRGRDDHFRYYLTDATRVSVPAGEFPTHQVVLLDPEKPDRHLTIDFHPDWPGLILAAEYVKDGRRDTRLTMTQFNGASSR